jgi:hypothetical protein
MRRGAEYELGLERSKPFSSRPLHLDLRLEERAHHRLAQGRLAAGSGRRREREHGSREAPHPTFKPTPEYQDKCDERCMHDNRYDAFKLYPEIYLMPDGRLYFTREGDWVSLRTCDTAFMRKTKHTYWATLDGTPDAPTVSFQRGPDRPEDVTSYGTSLFDPNTGKIEIFGGQPTSPGTFYPLNAKHPTHFAGGRGSRKMEAFHLSASEPGGGHWTLEPNFLGEHPQDDRTMHYAIALPTRQIGPSVETA